MNTMVSIYYIVYIILDYSSSIVYLLIHPHNILDPTININSLISLQVINILERRTISNVFAVIYGKVEPG